MLEANQLRRETRTAKKNQITSEKKPRQSAPSREKIDRPAEKPSKLQAGELDTGSELVIPVTAEQLEVAKEQIVTGSVRISKQVHERTETIDEPTLHEEVEVKRVPLNQFVDQPPEVRVEGDTTIIPVVEEVLVVEKRFRVKEEVRITRKRKEVRDRQQVNLRSEEVKIERRNGEG